MDTPQTPMLEFDVQAMSCGHCVGAITRAVKALDPQAEVACDLPARKVRVRTLKPRGDVVHALAEEGYKPA
jgi:copper chaperone